MSWMNFNSLLQTDISNVASHAIALMQSFYSLVTNMTEMSGLNVFASADSLSPNKASPPAMQLLDIELPKSPDFDWWPWMAFGFGVILLFAVIVLLIWLRNRFWTTFRLQLQLERWLKTLPDVSEAELPTQAMLIYQTFSQSRELLIEPYQQSLNQQLNQLCFSQQKASRETLQVVLEYFRQALIYSLKQRPSLWQHFLTQMRKYLEMVKRTIRNGEPNA